MIKIGKQYKILCPPLTGQIVTVVDNTSPLAVPVKTTDGKQIVVPSYFLVDKDKDVTPEGRITKFRYNGFEMYGILFKYVSCSLEAFALVTNGIASYFQIPIEDLIYVRPTKTKTIQDETGAKFRIHNNGKITKGERGHFAYCYCHHCGKIKPLYNFQFGTSDIEKRICHECWETRGYFVCRICNNVHRHEELAEGYSNVCQDCFHRNAYECPYCGRLTLFQDSEYIYGQHCCKECADNPEISIKCVCCHNPYPANKIKHLEGRPVCRDCYKTATHYDGYILNYHRPYFNVFRGEKDDLHMGVELEIDKGGEMDSHARTIWEKLGKYNAVMMRDGSLNNGLEIVSSPATYEAHKNEIHWDEAMNTAIGLGYKSHNTLTCGLHVHVDRAYFEPMPREVYEDKFAMLFANNADWIKRFSRRTVWNYCQIEPGASQKTSVEDAKKGICKARPYKGANHRVAINYGTDKPTIEIRIFRGTLKHSTFLATLQFVQMFCDFVKHIEFADIAGINLPQFIKTANEKGFTEFITYLEERNITAERSDESLDSTTI